MEIKNNGIALSLTELTKIKRKQTLKPDAGGYGSRYSHVLLKRR